MRESRAVRNAGRFLGGFCFITDRKVSSLSAEEMAAVALEAGAVWIQYREKEKSRKELYHEASKLRELTRRYGAVLIVNDHPDIALAVDADGVHLGQEDLPLREARRLMGGKIVGISTHSVSEAIDAFKGGADYIGFGPVFRTATKEAGEPRGTAMLGEIKRRVEMPVVAIGGISVENLPSVLDSGADAVAVASAVLRGDILKNVKDFLEIIGAQR